MKKIITAFFILGSIFLILAVSACRSVPDAPGDPVQEIPVQPDEPVLEDIPDVVLPEEPDAEEEFDPSTIPQEVFDSTKIDVQELIQNLNSIIRSRDYDTWVSYLGKDYFAAISSPDYLAQISESARLKTQRIVLRTPQDYFQYVVVPSRANDRVDDIEFIGQNRVKAYTITPNGQRLRLYNLEKNADGWKIIN
ncbi:hypothetical protein [Breznakiella homolactica]|uniref:Uncharacterized protein n=1 Tax=Breznakiella homolactica TaxID=2798577 RepID=A0A7T7XKQ8_9SPIR|nr:hypothetical protein [Breznakiella homolactica]QQO08141.1 hypothetical protein JFL75_14485 [Breznakiella homolactica]